jgi:ApbE superfamily uncharacterized protein (UPF0280 family)
MKCHKSNAGHRKIYKDAVTSNDGDCCLANRRHLAIAAIIGPQRKQNTVCLIKQVEYFVQSQQVVTPSEPKCL